MGGQNTPGVTPRRPQRQSNFHARELKGGGIGLFAPQSHTDSIIVILDDALMDLDYQSVRLRVDYELTYVGNGHGRISILKSASDILIDSNIDL
jgi:hypothetical protein